MNTKTLSTRDHDHILERIVREDTAGRGEQDCFEPYIDMAGHNKRMAVLEKTSPKVYEEKGL